MAQTFAQILQSINNSEIRIALEMIMKIAGVNPGDITGPSTLVGDLTGDVTGDLTGNVTGNVDGNLDGLVTDTDSAAVAATSGAVAVPVTNIFSSYITNATAAIAATLADGVVGQIKVIKLKTKDTNNMVLTPANLGDGTTITFDATGEVAVLMFLGATWEVIYTNATVA
jgi:hypothetical protein